eukprot:scaffold53600_cov64-Phaeocystis_antarctica.AAC.2
MRACGGTVASMKSTCIWHVYEYMQCAHGVHIDIVCTCACTCTCTCTCDMHMHVHWMCTRHWTLHACTLHVHCMCTCASAAVRMRSSGTGGASSR